MTAPVPTIEHPTENAPQAPERRWWLVLVAAAAVALVVIAALVIIGGDEPADDPTLAPPAVEEPESGDGAGVGLPAPAMTTAREIFAFAQRGDLDSLAGLALAGETEFTASFGDAVTTPAQLVALWEQIGRDEVLRWMTALVQLPDWYQTQATNAAGTRVTIHVTPRFMHEPTAANRQLLEERVGAAAVETSNADGQWLGWRLGITAEGDWQFFVSGD